MNLANDMQNLIQAQLEIFEALKLEVTRLQEIRSVEKSLIEKWQMFLEIILPIQINVVQKYGFQGDQQGLSSFNEKYLKYSEQENTLWELNEQKWLFLFEHAFGLNEIRKLSLDEATALLKDIFTAMISESFLKKVDEVMARCDDAATMLEKRQALLEVLLLLHMSVMEKHHFIGEKGYLQAQRALMDYYHIPELMKGANYAQKVLFERAGL